jgi:hypothetical protein
MRERWEPWSDFPPPWIAIPAVSRLLRLYEKKRGERRTGSSKLGSVGETLFFAVFLIFGIAAFAIMLANIAWPELRANRHYLETRCTILKTAISERRTDDGLTYRPDITIAYKVSGRKFETVTYDAARMYSSSEANAQEVVNQFHVGEQYACWYDPGDPQQAVLVRGYSGWMYLLLLVPVSFIIIGGGGLIYTLYHWGTSAERRSALEHQAARIDLAGEVESEHEDYPQIPPPTDAKSSPGTRLTYRLPIATSPGWQLFGAFCACVFWNAITSVFVVLAIRSHVKGAPEWFLTLFIIPFVLIGLILVFVLVRQLLITTGIGPTRMEISHYPLHPGESCDLYLSQAGRLSMNSLRVVLVCNESATFRQGTDTRTERRCVYEQTIFVREGFEIDPATPFEHEWKLQIPQGSMHSFKSAHNEIRWQLSVQGNVAGWPDFARDYPLIVYPPRAVRAEG